MKKSTFFFTVLLFAAFQTIFSANINVSIVGTSYSPAAVNAAIGDVVTIAATTSHPLVEVDQTNWNANNPTPVSGWTNKTTPYTFTVTTAGTFYYGCAVHMPVGMKGFITMSPAGIQQITATAHSIDLYPNPVVNGEFTITSNNEEGNSSVLVCNALGKLVETHQITGTTTRIRTDLPSGIYFYTVMIGTRPVYRNKFVIAKAQ